MSVKEKEWKAYRSVWIYRGKRTWYIFVESGGRCVHVCELCVCVCVCVCAEVKDAYYIEDERCVCVQRRKVMCVRKENVCVSEDSACMGM